MLRITTVALATMLLGATAAAGQSSGQQIFQGKGNCFVCHGKDAKGGPLAPDLTDAEWLNIDGSLEAILNIVRKGVPKPVRHPAPMMPMGGAKLSSDDVMAVAKYVKSLSAGPSQAGR